MANLNTKTISAGVTDILAVDGGVTGSGKNVKDGAGNVTPLWVDTTKIGIGATPTAPLHITSSGVTGLKIERTGSTENVDIEFINTEGSPTSWFIGKAQNGGFGISDGHEDLDSTTNRLYISEAGNIGVGTVTPSASLHIDQSSSSGAVPVLKLDQADTDDSFIDFIGTSASDQTKSLSTDTSVGALTGHIKIEINGAPFWLAYYAPN